MSFIKIILCIVLSCCVFVALIYTERKMLTDYEKVSVVVAKETIEKGTDITDQNKNKLFTVVEYAKGNVPNGAFKDIKDVPNGVISHKVSVKLPMTKNTIRDTSEYEKNIENPIEVSISTLNISQALAGTLRRGDAVTIISTATEEQKAIENVYISKAFTADGKELKPGETGNATMFTLVTDSNQSKLLSELIKDDKKILIVKTSDTEF